MPDAAELLRAGGTAFSSGAVIHPFSFCPLYVARGRKIGCEGATDRLPRGPSSAQRPLNSVGHAAGGAARAGAPRPQAARCAGRGGAPQPGLRYPARDTHGVGRPLGGEDDPLHGYPVRRPPQPRDPRVLWTPGGLRQAEKGSAQGLHEETTDHPGRDVTELDPLAAAVATGLLGAAERARRSPRRSKRVGKTARSYLT